MKNIHILPTDQKSRLHCYFELNKIYTLSKEPLNWRTAHHIYITSDEEIKEGDYGIDLDDNSLFKCKSKYGEEFTSELLKNGNLRGLSDYDNCKKIILTTDSTLIVDGIQSIDDEFLEWFCSNNGNVDYVDVEGWWRDYKIILPQEEPKTNLEKLPFPKLVEEFVKYYKQVPLVDESKEETLEEAAEKYAEGWGENDDVKSFIAGVKWQAERMYNEQEVIAIIEKSRETGLTAECLLLFEQFKKK